MNNSDANPDREILDSFVEEINRVKGDLSLIFLALHENHNQPRLFERFGQIIDGIYGTAATLGFAELANYTRMLKRISYKCSRSDNLYAMGKVKDLIFVCVENLDRLTRTIHDPKAIRQLRLVFESEIEKANSLAKAIFGHIRSDSLE